MNVINASVENQAQLRVFLKKVRRRHGLSQEKFASLLGLGRPMFAAFERDERNLGYDSVQKVADALKLDQEAVAAMFEPAEPVAFPPPETICLNPRAVEATEILIDLDMAAKMASAISAAGKALPLAKLLQIAR